ncbi:hypothetical protein [Pelagovum pacificum]|uniref:Uncharacterized protein n=1 Tax=Pelagovum pacificum TaxID=2588711 RepID=A0A5C5GJK8_9RHOB|nr:hypothetical protein [Pelagovum pacificum]QQA42801.1 hypothetical protein I8N54_18855 [Pelagovum pacificum]TNY34051.1 hypothetical protein FHY64_12535 [Pelagovum pacificum]
MVRITTLALLCLVAAPATAQERESERYERKRLSAGEVVSRTYECSGGMTAISGGYRLYGQPDNSIDFMVVANYPDGRGGWRIDIRNVTDRAQELAFRIYAICQ